MATNETAIENEIQAKGLNAPRLTPQMIDDAIMSEHYVRASDVMLTAATCTSEEALSCLTLCVLVLKNGFTIVGKSACASPANFDMELGRKIAKDDARRQIWALEGYSLRSKLAA